MNNVWQDLLRRLVCDDFNFTFDEVQRWNRIDFDALKKAGLLQEATRAAHVTCDACPDAHWEEIRWAPNGQRAFIPCPREGVVDVDPERMRQWTIDTGHLAILLAGALELPGQPQALAVGRLWRLGRCRIGGQFRDFFFAVTPEEGLPTVIREAQHSLVTRAGLLILPFHPEVDTAWEPARLKAVALSDIATWQNGEITPDLDFIADIFTRDHAAGKRLGVRSLPIPDHAKWQDLLIEIFETAISIEVGGYKKDLSFERAGFGERDQRLETLKLLAASRGRLGAERISVARSGKTPIKNRIHELRQLLQTLFPIDGRPIAYHTGAGIYECKFRVRLAGESSFPTPSGVSWLDFRFVERRDGRLVVSVNEKKIFRTHQAERGPGGPVEEVGQRDEIVPHLYSLEDLKMRNTKGQLTPEGTVLVEMLRGEGRLKRRGDDTAVLKLGGWLRKWISLEGHPLRYSESTRTWTAAFECSSERG